MLIPINTGDQFVTRSKAITSPFPKLSKRITKRETSKMHQWLKINVVLEAERQGNSFAKNMFERLDINNWSPADGDSVHQFLFGDKYVNGHIGDLKVKVTAKKVGIVSDLQLNEECVSINSKDDNSHLSDPLIAWAFT